MAKQGRIRVGIGGWTFEPWRGTFYPKGLPHARELEYASEHLTTIEINGTFYRTQTPATFAKWAKDMLDGFVFSVKGPRYAVNRSVLGEAGDFIKRFFEFGVLELGDKLGPMLWQFAPHKKFDRAQDVSISQLRFLAALTSEQPSHLFFAGDLGQRIFQQPFSWKSLGVDIRGRSHTLRINYRTSHQIRIQADRLLALTISDVDGILKKGVARFQYLMGRNR